MQNQRQRRPHHPPRPVSTPRSRVVIADDGIVADVVIIDPASPSDIGASFLHRGRRWVINGRRRHSRVLVAKPAESSRQ